MTHSYTKCQTIAWKRVLSLIPEALFFQLSPAVHNIMLRVYHIVTGDKFQIIQVNQAYKKWKHLNLFYLVPIL